MDIKRDKNGEEIITTVIGDFFIRWGIFVMVGGLLFAAAMNAKDFEKNRQKHLKEAGNFVQQKKENIKNNCMSEMRKIINDESLSQYNLIKLAENNFKITEKRDYSFYIQNKPLFYKILLCEKQMETFSKLEVINE